MRTAPSPAGDDREARPGVAEQSLTIGGCAPEAARRARREASSAAAVGQSETATNSPVHLARVLKTHGWIHPLTIAVAMGLLLAGDVAVLEWRLEWPSWLGVAVLLALVLPALQSAVVAVVGLSLPRRATDDLRDAPDVRSFRRLHVCVVTRGVNRAALRRTYEQLAPLMDDRMQLDVLTEQPVDVPHVLVPPEFTTVHARFKARALEYYRVLKQLDGDDWVLHVDEESVTDRDSLEACLRFCRRSPWLLGQGILFYNNHGFWRHPAIAVADAVRTGDDLGRFFAQLAWLHRPVFGLHGSFLLVNGALENEITWDLEGWLVEDYAFALQCVKRGHGCGWIDGFVREQSPQSILDFLRQRRRWIVGIRGLSRESAWAAYWVTMWQLAPFGRLMALAATWSSFSPWWLVVSSQFAAVTYLYVYVVGMLVQDRDRGTGDFATLGHTLVVIALLAVAMLLETAAVVWALFTRRNSLGFQVVAK